MLKISSKPESNADQAELLDLIPKLTLAPWEDQGLYDALQKALFDELKPASPQEQLLAQEIVDCDWDGIRSKELSQSLVTVSFRKAATALLQEKANQLFPSSSEAGIVNALESLEQGDVETTLATLKDYGVSVDDIRVRAYLDHMAAIETLARRPLRFDERRRALRDEYRELKTMRLAKAAEEAELAENHDDA